MEGHDGRPNRPRGAAAAPRPIKAVIAFVTGGIDYVFPLRETQAAVVLRPVARAAKRRGGRTRLVSTRRRVWISVSAQREFSGPCGSSVGLRGCGRGPDHMSGLQPTVSMTDQAWATVVSLLDQTWAVAGVLGWATKQLSIIFPFSQLYILQRPLVHLF